MWSFISCSTMLQSFRLLHESERIRIEQQSCDFAIVNGEFTQQAGRRWRSKRKISEISCPAGYIRMIRPGMWNARVKASKGREFSYARSSSQFFTAFARARDILGDSNQRGIVIKAKYGSRNYVDSLPDLCRNYILQVRTVNTYRQY